MNFAWLKLLARIDTCPSESSFLTFPNWYRGLQCQYEGGEVVGVHFTALSNIWTVLANIADILIQVAGLFAVFLIIYGGFRYITSQGNPDSLKAAKKILTNAVIGLLLAILASTIVGYIAGLFG